jgi:hypothetical protein
MHNRSGYYVITHAPGLEEHTVAFERPPAAPDLGSIVVELTIRDLGRRFLPRRSAIVLPRDPDPDNAGNANALFRPIDIAMYLAPTAPVSSGWATIRATLTVQDTDPARPLAGALVLVTRVVDGETRRIGLGLADERGEALVGVSGIPVTTWSEEETDEVIVTEIDATLQVVFDPALRGVPNPDVLEAQRAELPSASRDIRLAAGRELVTTVEVPLTDE